MTVPPLGSGETAPCAPSHPRAAFLRPPVTRATPAAPLAHLAMDSDGRPDGAALTLTTWPEGRTEPPGHACLHGRGVHWQA